MYQLSGLPVSIVSRCHVLSAARCHHVSKCHASFSVS